ncbi:DUF6545 domain-containing protein [Streptomyces sp. NPDC001127]|uniref:DUF6545 domain-containing protein n=1 Tax=Streptomyces sp. NPDC001127 TaxID=3154377 RepID=UPI00332B43F9
MLVFTPADSAVPVVPLLPPLGCLLTATAVLVPTLAAAGRAPADTRTIWRLWPLWRGLIDAVPEAVLNSPRCRLCEVLRPGFPRQFLMYRKLIEIRDAILVLHRHIDTTTAQAARSHVATAEFSEPLGEATVLACLVREGCRAHVSGGPELPQPYEIVGPPIDNLGQEKAFLLRPAAAYERPLARAFRTPGDHFPGRRDAGAERH